MVSSEQRLRKILALVITLILFISVAFLLFKLTVYLYPDASWPIRLMISTFGAAILGTAGFFSGLKDLYDMVIDILTIFLKRPTATETDHLPNMVESKPIVTDEKPGGENSVNNIIIDTNNKGLEIVLKALHLLVFISEEVLSVSIISPSEKGLLDLAQQVSRKLKMFQVDSIYTSIVILERSIRAWNDFREESFRVMSSSTERVEVSQAQEDTLENIKSEAKALKRKLENAYGQRININFE